MKKKCYLSLLLVLSMLIPTVMPVSAAVADAQILSGYTITGWSELVNPGNNGIVVGPTDFDAKTGDYSLCGIFPTKNLSSNENGVYINNTAQTVTLTAGTAYTYGVWVKADVNVFRIWPYLWVGSYEEKYELQKQSTVVDGWTKYEKTFTPTSNVTGKLRLGFHSNLSGYKDSYNSITVLLDDAYMYASGSDVNLVDNPSFDAEEAQQQEDPPGPPASFDVETAQLLSGYKITGWSNLISPEDKGVRVGPTNDHARTGDYSLLAIFPTVKTYQNEYIKNTSQTVTVTAGKTYTFGVWLKYNEGISPRKTWPYICVGSYSEDWDLEPGEKTDGWQHYTKTFTPSATVTGNLKFGFQSDMSAYSDSYTSIKVLFDDIYIYEEGTSENLIDNPGFDAEEAQQNPPDPPAQDDFDSAQMLLDYKITEWSDLLNADDKGVRVGPTDYARTGDFSLCVIFPTIKTYQHDYIENTTQSVTVTAGKTYTFGVWLKYADGVNPRKTWPYICVGSYSEDWDLEPGEKENGWQHYTKTFTPSATVKGNLKFGFQSDMSAYSSLGSSVKILFDDAYMYEEGSDENLVSNPGFEAQLDDTDDFKIYDPKLYSGENEVLKTASGEYSVRTRLRNNRIDTPVPITQIIALYKGDILKKVVSTSVLAGKLDAGEPSVIIEGNIEVPDTDHHIEVFIWDSKNGMKSLYDFVTFNSGE